MAEEARTRLGRGLAMLIGDTPSLEQDAQGYAQTKAPIEFLRPNPRNPRQSFDEAELQELAESIRERGIIQPILVRHLVGMTNVYEIIAGERRWRAAQRVGLHEVPIVVVEADDRQSLEFAIIENVQRSDLNALEEAMGYERLTAEFSYNQTDLAKIIGKSRSHVANTIRLLKLPEEAKKYLVDGSISAGHARALLSVENPERMARQIVDEGLTVRDVERLVQERAAPPENKAPAKAPQEKDADTRALEKLLTDLLGLTVKINHKGETGDVRIQYKSLEQLDLLCKRLQG
ncbi:ParB/RepB/Spo0J family partition protein [uncultured Rhodoblastus sp.]|uniref:ParB/RepB/Spo0J family partition protein n=1 Tax=uncultured Rhodoblastus sp. TaxID=543037 RepID=UPI0025E9CC3B|nr:ParB/RepB/Spo0J family partition protein [uncultured Rhodoblastus sp.]